MFQSKTKKLLVILLVVCLWALSLAVVAWAEEPIKLIVNGVEIQSDVPPQVINGRTMIPARALAEALGAKVEWDAEQRAVIITALSTGGNPTDLPSASGSSSGSNTSGPNSGMNSGSNSSLESPSGSPGSNTGSDSSNEGPYPGIGSVNKSSSGAKTEQGSTPVIGPFTGTWDTDWGKMELVQVGNNVNGTYEHDQGKIVGTVSGDTMVGTWSEYPSYSPPSDAGDVTLTLNPGGMSFSGKWRYGSSGGYSTWDGTRQ